MKTIPQPAQHVFNTRAILKLFLAALVPLAAAMELSRAEGFVLYRNLVVDAGIITIFISSFFLRGRAEDLPLPRSRWLMPLAAGAAAILCAYPTLTLPYLGDDWFLLEKRGQASFFDAINVISSEPWFRPVGWAFWWVFYQLSPVDATLARWTCVLIFAIDAMLVIPALRRCGFSRGVASAAALLFAAAPASIETVAWITNMYSLLACGFILASLATLPFGNYTPRRMFISCLLALLAFLSKEDSYLYPAMAALALGRFRIRNIFRGLLRAWIFFLMVMVVAAVRYLLLGGGGAYKNEQSGESLLIQRMFWGPLIALRTECPGRYFLPTRWNPIAYEKRMLWWIIPPVLLAWGGISAAARRGVWRGWLIFAIGIAPVAPMLPIGRMIECARWLFVPTVGIVAFVASCLAGGPLRGRAAWIPVAAFVVLFWFVSNNNLDAWRSSSEIFTKGVELATPLIKETPRNGKVWVAGLPLQVQGAYCFNNAIPFAFNAVLGRTDLEYVDPVMGRGLLDAVIEVDIKNQRAANLLDPKAAIDLAAGEEWSTPVNDEADDGKNYRIVNFIELWSPEGKLYKAGLFGYLLLPTFRIPVGAKVEIQIVGGLRDENGPSGTPLLFCTMLTPEGILRMPRQIGEPFLLAESSRLFRPEIIVSIGKVLYLEEIRVRVIP
ncbi:MAG: hypothetical protein ACKVS6_16170 [Planctomycetota bacterium]